MRAWKVACFAGSLLMVALPKGNGQKLQDAAPFMQAAGNDKNLAREMAKQAGWATAGKVLTGSAFALQGGWQGAKGLYQMHKEALTPENLQQTLMGGSTAARALHGRDHVAHH
jgi:hypothetical protein